MPILNPDINLSDDWTSLLDSIAAGQCTPFLGAGANGGLLPLGRDIAQMWANQSHYPFEDAIKLDSVAQFMAVKFGALNPKTKIIDYLKSIINKFDETDLRRILTDRNKVLGALAHLPFPIYITTNYDNLLVKSLEFFGKSPKVEICRWNKVTLSHFQSVFEGADGFIPTAMKPVVFHLHGNFDAWQSLVLTEEDYVDFLVSISSHNNHSNFLLPPRIEEALVGPNLLFVGYSLGDINFRVIRRGLLAPVNEGALGKTLSVQIPPSLRKAQPADPAMDDEQQILAEQKAYLEKFF